jgi:hypothetical protein
LKIENPVYIATEEILWVRADGTEVLIQACVGIPYKSTNAWACPAALVGVDDRYPDIVGESSFQALNLAMRLIRQRLGHLLDAGEVLTYPIDRSERWDLDSLDVVFGRV